MMFAEPCFLPSPEHVSLPAMVARCQSPDVSRSSGTALLSQGVTYICQMLGSYGLSRSEAAALLNLNEQMGHAFDQSLASILQALVR
jgi:hypothetical protein